MFLPFWGHCGRFRLHHFRLKSIFKIKISLLLKSLTRSLTFFFFSKTQQQKSLWTSGFRFFAVFLLFPVFNNNQTELMSDSIFKTMHLEDKTKELIGWSKCKWYWYENSNSKYICNKFIVDLFLKFNESHYKHGFHHNVLSIKWVKDVALLHLLFWTGLSD